MEFGNVLMECGEVHKALVKSARFTPDEKLAATDNFAQEVSVFEMETGKKVAMFNHSLKVEAVAFTPDARFLAVGGYEKTLTFYRVADWKMALEIPMPRIEYIDFSTEGRLMVTGHEDSHLIQLYMFLPNTQQRGNYQQIANEQLDNKDLKKQD